METPGPSEPSREEGPGAFSPQARPAGLEPFPFEDHGFVPPDPDEPPPVELWSAVGDVPPFATVLLLLSWGVCFAAMAWRGDLDSRAALAAWGAATQGATGIDAAWRLLAATFLHAGAAHIFFNATSMLIWGPAVERVFTAWNFAWIYVAGGACASEVSVLWREWRHPGTDSLSVGASGAIFALGGALLVAGFRLRHRLAPGRARALGAATLFLMVQGLVSGATRNGTDNAAHAAGLVSGALLGAIAPMSPRLGGPGIGWAGRALGTLATLALLATLAWSLRSGLGYP
jgi:rhomboid protease GluP